MAKAAPGSPTPRHLAVFLDKIAADRDRELEAIAQRLKQEAFNIHRQAYAEAIDFHRRHAGAARQRRQQEREQRLSRARAAARRQRWRLLSELQERMVVEVMERMEQAWRQPEPQQAWCRYWLEAALARADGAALAIRLGAGALEPTETALKALLAKHPQPCPVSHDPEQAPGILIEWDSSLLDGGLDAQRPEVEQRVFTELTDLLHSGEIRP